MSEWKEIQLGNLAEIQTGPFGSQLKNEQYVVGGTPVITVEHLKDFKIIDFTYPSVNENDKKRLSKYLLKAGDIVFTRVGSVDLSAFVKEHQDGWMFSSRMLRVRPNLEVINSRFLSYFFRQKSFRDYILNISVGATMPSINTEILKGVPISYPDLPEQTAIASILSSLDDKIDLLHRQNATLEKMAETLFRQWFVEEAKEEWEEGTLSYFADFYNGKTRPNELGTFPIYGGNGILGFTNKSNFTGKSIIIGRVGAYCGSVYYENKEIWVSDNALLMKTKIAKTTHFLYYLMKSLDLNSMAEGSSHPLLTQTLLKSIEIKIPPIETICNFDSIIENIQNKIDSNQTQIQTLTALRDTLLPKLMSGEVKVEC